MIVYGTSVAPSVRKVLAFIAEKGLAAEHRPVMPQDASAEFRHASPFGYIPGFREGAFVLSDSTAICQYIERKHPLPALLPEAPEALGRAIWLDRFADNFLGAVECRIVTEALVKPHRGETPDKRVLTRALADELPPLCDYLEAEIAGPFLVGGALSLADLAVASPFASLRLAGHLPDAARWPKLSAYIGAILARPAMAGIGEGGQAR
jgi:glutathione S-transferase